MWHRKERRPSKKAVFRVTQSKSRTLLFGGGECDQCDSWDQESGEELNRAEKLSKWDPTFCGGQQVSGDMDTGQLQSWIHWWWKKTPYLHQVGEWYWVSWNDLRVTCHLTFSSGLWSEIVMIESLIIWFLILNISLWLKSPLFKSLVMMSYQLPIA